MIKDDSELNDQALYLLQEIKNADERITGSLLVASDGLLVAHNLPEAGSSHKAAAMSAALHALAKSLAPALKVGENESVQLQCELGYVHLLNAGNYTLAVITRGDLEIVLLTKTIKAAVARLNFEFNVIP